MFLTACMERNRLESVLCTVSVTSCYSSTLKADHSAMNKGILIKTTKGM